MTPDEILDSIRARLSAMGNAQAREAMQRYFKETIRAYGVSAPKVKTLSQEVARIAKPWTEAQRNRFCTALLQSGMSEEGGLAIYFYRRFARHCHACEFRLFERWLDRYVDNWAWCDGLSCWLIAACLANEPSLMAEIPEWTESKNRWKRRAAAVSLVPAARRGESTELILDVANRLRTDEDDMVRKGVGWLLKDAYPKKPRQVLQFLTTRQPPLARLVLRIASEKMTPEHRSLVLARGPR
jgi:3-methyladenine DNA glycosylase AlkD